jgi:hypothetical protein
LLTPISHLSQEAGSFFSEVENNLQAMDQDNPITSTPQSNAQQNE